jgi:hypothetical protein
MPAQQLIRETFTPHPRPTIGSALRVYPPYDILTPIEPEIAMSQLDRHVAAVQNRLALAEFFHALAWTALLLAGVILILVGIDKLFWWSPPRPWIWIEVGAGAAVLLAIIGAMRNRPSKIQAAAAIDQKLSLDEKISTALYVRPSDDPFAMAAVKDAEAAAQNAVVNYRTHFPFQFPRLAPWAALACVAAFLLATYARPLDLFGREAAIKKQIVQKEKIEFSKKQLQDALAVVNSVPQSIGNDETIKLAKQELSAQLNKNIDDPAKASRTALKALQDVDAAVKEQIKTNSQFAQAKADEKMWRQIGEQPITDPGPVNEVRKELAQGKFGQAMDDLSKVVNNFDKMDKKDQDKAAEQMKQMAQQLAQQANATPQQQQQMQQQLQQMGLSQPMAQQAQQLMQQAANGDKQAQQQLQQMAQQAMQQMNNGQGPTQQQKQAAQQMMQQMQAAANNQAQAQQLAQAAQQMAQAMQQQAQQKQGGQQQQQQGQQAAQQAGQGQKGAQQGQQQQQQASQSQQGTQQGQQQGKGQQGMGQGMQQMQQQLQQMQAVAGDAQQIAAAQQGLQQGAQQAMNGANGQPGGQDGGGQGQWGAADGQNPPQGAGQPGPGNNKGGGKGFGGAGDKAEAPYTLKQEVDTSERIESGKLLATTFVKASALKGENKLELKDIAANAEKDEADEIDQDRISRPAQGVVREYFNTMERDASAPATQP